MLAQQNSLTQWQQLTATFFPLCRQQGWCVSWINHYRLMLFHKTHYLCVAKEEMQVDFFFFLKRRSRHTDCTSVLHWGTKSELFHAKSVWCTRDCFNGLIQLPEHWFHVAAALQAWLILKRHILKLSLSKYKWKKCVCCSLKTQNKAHFEHLI